MLLTILIFIILLGALVLAHEWGHFFAARRFGVRVEEFAFGFPPRVASFVRKGTRYALNFIPIGGYVKIYGESGGDGRDPESFSSRPLFQRFAIIAAGVAMNVVLAWALFSTGHGIGLPTVVGEGEMAAGAAVTIIGVAPDSPAERAGLEFGDVIKEVKSRTSNAKIERLEDVQKFIDAHRGEEVIFQLKRGRELMERTAVARREPPPGEGAVGIAMADVGIVRSPWWRAPWDGAKTTMSAAVAITTALGRTVRDLFSEGRLAAEVSGPVGIFVFANESRRLGIAYLLELAGILSVNLALLNILPIPALDGGRILFLFIEGVRGVKMNQRLEQAIHTVGFALLILLMAAITYRDVVRIF
ncbi:MAG: site-2 protease family protein [Candidatus Sungbacteria bacterium]|uniref:Site-2 protease family protein n=1 Tax=Candidatus Sungiibacteriota bacterium TaxID=2750080 RepID=A0A932YW74_9BACT|nr:site-2 protease family protein [Candidatus Sungbacteria bacterium]